MSQILRNRSSRIILSHEVQAAIETHSFSRVDVEVGGILLGKIQGVKTFISAFVPALEAEEEQTSLKITHEAWASILSTVARDHDGLEIVGWYHTHPSFGVFMSDYDSFIQTNFFPEAGYLGLVIDPISGEMGWFVHSKRKKIVSLVFLEKTLRRPILDSPTSAQKGPSALTLWSQVPTLWASLVTVSAFVLGFFIAKLDVPPDVSGVVRSQKFEIQYLQDEISESLAALVSLDQNLKVVMSLEHPVPSGDLAEILLGDKTQWESLASTQPDLVLENGAVTGLIDFSKLPGLQLVSLELKRIVAEINALTESESND